MKRKYSLDLIRCIALIFVFATHFFTHIGFYQETILLDRSILMILLRNLFITCVPLFLLLTGYLMNQKIWSKRYYTGLIRVLLIYFVASCIIWIWQGKPWQLPLFLKSILNFEAAGYSWYIEMYVGLYVLIPLLNLCYHHPKNGRKQKLAVVVSMVFLTALPSVTNIFFQVLPEWWMQLYPITLYFIGAYLSEYAYFFKKKYAAILLILALVIETSGEFLESYGRSFIWEEYSDYCGIFTLCVSVGLFLLLLKKDEQEKGNKVIAYISRISLGMYLLSEIADQIIYPKVFQNMTLVQDKFLYFLPVISGVFLISFLLGMLNDGIVQILMKLFGYRKKKRMIYI